MCGIGAEFSSEGGGSNTTKSIEKIVQLIEHRGNPGANCVKQVDDRCVLGFARLAIINLSEDGDQPYSIPVDKERGAGNSIHSVVNGEIWNHEDLRQTVLKQFNIQGGSDAKVVPYLYQKYGPKFLGYLDGFFGLFVYDQTNNTFVAAVDKFGVKPLFYVKVGTTYYFSSEAKGFVGLKGLDASCEIARIPPGGMLTPQGIQFYFSFQLVRQLPYLPLKHRLEVLLTQAVQKRLMSDIPVGTFLSGGIDSGMVTAIAHKLNPNVEAFTIGLPGSWDVENAKRIAKHLGIKHHIYTVTQEEIDALIEKTVWTTESFSPIIVIETILITLVSRYAREKGFQVLLSGAGVDEYLAGYPDFLDKSHDEVQALKLSYLFNLHATELRMLDLGTMQETVEAREPFLDPDLVMFGVNLPLEGIFGTGPDGRIHNKFILRELAADYLPEDIPWLKKVPMTIGVGAEGTLYQKYDVSKDQLKQLQRRYPKFRINTSFKGYLFLTFQRKFGEIFCRFKNSFQLFGTYPGVDDFVDAVNKAGDIQGETKGLDSLINGQMYHKMFKSMLRKHANKTPTAMEPCLHTYKSFEQVIQTAATLAKINLEESSVSTINDDFLELEDFELLERPIEEEEEEKTFKERKCTPLLEETLLKDEAVM